VGTCRVDSDADYREYYYRANPKPIFFCHNGIPVFGDHQGASND
jgi:hypothetical protein